MENQDSKMMWGLAIALVIIVAFIWFFWGNRITPKASTPPTFKIGETPAVMPTSSSPTPTNVQGK